jgi:hypothetical protein
VNQLQGFCAVKIGEYQLYPLAGAARIYLKNFYVFSHQGKTTKGTKRTKV